MIELSLLGTPELRRSGESSEALLVQPRRLALLAYLAVSKGAFHRRDRLLLLFWGEQPESRARASLRQALYFIRQSLGDDILVTRGDDEVGLNPDLVRVDVTDLEAALADGRAEDALSLYRGDFLAHFNIDRAPEFDRWAAQKQREIRLSVVSAAWQLAEGALESGMRDTAIQWALRAIDLSDYSESDVRRAMRMLVTADDRAKALEIYATLCERLDADHDAAPEAATTDLASELRSTARASTAVPAPSIAPEFSPLAGPGPGAVVNASAPRSAAVATQRPRTNSGRKFVVATIVAACIAVGGAFAWRGRVVASEDPGISSRVAVFPFTVRSQLAQTGYLREGVATLLGLALDNAGRLRVVDPNAVLSAAPQSADLVEGRRVAQTLGAGQFVLGEIDQSGSRLNIAATLYDIDGRTQVRATVTGEDSRLFDLVDSLARRLAVSAMTDSTVRLANDAATSTRSIDAFKAFLAGETALRAGHYRDAVASLQRAVAFDSSFGLAYYRLALAREWTDGEISSDSAAALAEHFSSRLPARDRKLLAARRAFVRRDEVEGEKLSRAVLATYPTDADAWAQLGEVLFHLGPNDGRSLDEARAPFLTVLRYRPNDLSARVHLTRIAARDGDSTHLNEWSGPTRSLGDASEIGTFELAAMRATVLGDASAHDVLVAATKRANDVTAISAIWRVAVYAGDPDAAADMAARRRADGFDAEDAYLTARVSGGHLASSSAAAPALTRSHAQIVGIMLALPSAPDLPVLARRAHDELDRVIAQRGDSATDAVFVASVLEARYPDSLGVLHKRPPVSAEQGRVTAVVADAIRSLATNPARALELMTSIESGASWRTDLPQWRSNLLYDVVASIRAEALHRLGRNDEAIAWLRSIGMNVGGASAPIALATRRIAELEDARGAHDVAARERLRFVKMWRTCDPELRPLVDDVRGGK